MWLHSPTACRRARGSSGFILVAPNDRSCSPWTTKADPICQECARGWATFSARAPERRAFHRPPAGPHQAVMEHAPPPCCNACATCRRPGFTPISGGECRGFLSEDTARGEVPAPGSWGEITSAPGVCWRRSLVVLDGDGGRGLHTHRTPERLTIPHQSFFGKSLPDPHRSAAEDRR